MDDDPTSTSDADRDWLVHPHWQDWAADNLARGAPAEDVVAALTEEGVAHADATRLVETLAGSAALGAARRLWWRVRALEQIVRLRREHRAAQPVGHSELHRGPLPSVDELLARYWVPGVPAVFTDLVPRWPAFSRWSLRHFAERYGDVVIEACVGRDGIDAPDAEWEQVKRELTMRELVTRIEAPDAGNDVYVIAKNAALQRPGLRPLLEDLELPPEIFGKQPKPERMGLWIGPAGTHTPLHHDGDNVMFCQVVGRKRFRIAPPESVALMDDSDGVYARWDPRSDADLRQGPDRLLELELAPGDVLFIPAGWWHQVDALDPSISVSILELAFPNDYGWYRPGTLLRGRGSADES